MTVNRVGVIVFPARREMGHDLVTVEIEVYPFGGGPALGTSKQLTIERPRCSEVMNWNGEVERIGGVMVGHELTQQKTRRAEPQRVCLIVRARKRSYLILPSLKSTCLRTTGSYFFCTIFSVMFRGFFLVV